MITNKYIDNGKSFDWGKTSADYAKYRDIYPDIFYKNIVDFGICISGQNVLDLGTGTGVLPRNMYKYGAKFTGTDISENQIFYARELAKKSDMDIDFYCVSTENIDFPDESFDIITACQCHFYFNHEILAPKAFKILKTRGKLAILYMAWLPFEDEIASKSEKLVLKYNPKWSGCNETRREVFVPSEYFEFFNVISNTTFDVKVPFTKESWNGRIKACRGIGASLNEDEIVEFEKEHLALLNEIANDDFEILHYCSIAILEKK